MLLAALALTARWLSNGDGVLASSKALSDDRDGIWPGLGNGHRNDRLAGQSWRGHLFPADSLRHAVVQDFSSSSHLLRLRVLHPIAGSDRFHLCLWLQAFWRKQERSPWMPSSHHTDSDCAWRNERGPLRLAADDASTVAEIFLILLVLCVRRSALLATHIRAFRFLERAPALIGVLVSNCGPYQPPRRALFMRTTTSDC